MATGAVIAAAGKPSAMEEFRPMMRISGTTMIQREIDTLRQAGVDIVVVVTGYEGERLERHLAHRGVICLRNESYEKGEMLDSVKLGLNYLAGKCSEVLFLPADAPLFSARTLEAVLAGQGQAVVPACAGKSGHPVLLREKIFRQILDYTGGRGLRGALEAAGTAVEQVEVEDPGVLLEVDNREDYEEALAYEKARKTSHRLYHEVRILLGREEVFFGPGTAQLLRLVDREGSLLSACKQMNMAYSKGWKMLKEAEEQAGFPFLTRRAGGADGGNSVLTEQGRAFLEAYRKMEEEVEAAAKEAFLTHFATARNHSDFI